MKNICVIPARMGSSRYPGKPMEKILGIPMIGHVYKRAKLCEGLDSVWVATCDSEIHDYIVSIGGKAVMTSDCHERCTDRCQEALHKIEKEIGTVDILVMVQGDEPLLHPDMIKASLAPFSDPQVQVVNLAGEILTEKEFRDPNEVKTILDLEDNAIYFSREPIPSPWRGMKGKVYRQVCVIPFRRDFLIRYSSLEPTPLEKIESIDMLRILEHGMKVKMVRTDFISKAVDTPSDLEEVEKIMRNDSVFLRYKNDFLC